MSSAVPGAVGLLWLWATMADLGPAGWEGTDGSPARSSGPEAGQPTRARVAPESSRSRWWPRVAGKA
jgi:hypothetical protein